MLGFRLVSLVVLSLATALTLVPSPVHAYDPRAYNSLEARYARAHSLGDSYSFDTRDGWQSVNVTDLQYKYARDYGEPDDEDSDDWEEEAGDSHTLETRANKKSKSKKKAKVEAKSHSKPKTTSNTKSKPKSKPKADAKSAASKVTSSFKKVVDSLRGVGKAEPVAITWYTGHDLENPSCWSNPNWAPTDASFACALTLEGWTTKPKCFKFLELCNSPKKCVFVRVVDSCAGCAKGSKHVDLTQAAFKELADLDTGLLTVQMRQATEPDGWLENLWGPQAS
ncbi:hypothetical protein PsYK624_004970 [Phanerochaete sordida]|uniref:RlpA-like protein double-psi beta-barrel domain-containing protein n=1 Tax=Phanerochaete sordida TaxID=48140 RepID=A0A9P3FXK5_9APHY|nr:hypothetical protein PsYK624_004970 [Phanerochaete sordida]